MDSDRQLSKLDILHERGHQLQSQKLGWLYFFVIGIPSAIGNRIDAWILSRIWSDNKRYKWYYSQPWEAWADKLGDVNRKFPE